MAYPWMERVLPKVVNLVELDPARTIFTRFLPPYCAEQVSGTWRRYYERWASMTRDRLHPDLIEIVPELRTFIPPAQVADKYVMSAWADGLLQTRLKAAEVDTLFISGVETEVCVLATVMGAIDRGYRVIIVSDAVCSGADSTHDAMLGIYRSRFGMQVETATAEEMCAAVISSRA